MPKNNAFPSHVYQLWNRQQERRNLNSGHHKRLKRNNNISNFSISSEYFTGNTLNVTDFRFYRIWVIKQKFFGTRFFGGHLLPSCTMVLGRTAESQRNVRYTGILPLCHACNTFTFLIPYACPTLVSLRLSLMLLTTVYKPRKRQRRAMTCSANIFSFITIHNKHYIFVKIKHLKFFSLCVSRAMHIKWSTTFHSNNETTLARNFCPGSVKTKLKSTSELITLNTNDD